MKKTLLFLLLMLPIGLLSSCSDDVESDLPQTDTRITLTFDNVAVINGIIYTTQDYAMEIASVTFKSPDGSTRSISDVEYMVDGKRSSHSDYAPYTGRIDTRDLSEGVHPLGVYVELNQSNNTVLPDNMHYNFTVVPTVEDLPDGAELGTFTQTFRVDPA